MAIKAFIMHASEDKEKFVLGFAEKLRLKGIDAWVDKWEIKHGDNIIEKVFEDGIKQAQIGIIVLSKSSVKKAFVREELAVNMMRKIQGKKRIIPVIIEDCEIPECLTAIYYETIKDLKNYDDNVDAIVASIYENSTKPSLGAPPKYAQTMVDAIPDLTKNDTIIFKFACEKAVELEHSNIMTKDIWEQAKPLDIPLEEFYESLEVLDNRAYIELSQVMGAKYPHFKITSYGFDEYARYYIPDYDEIVTSVAVQIVNHDQQENIKIAEALNKSLMIIDHILEDLNIKGLIRVSPGGMGIKWIMTISPELKRMMKNKINLE